MVAKLKLVVNAIRYERNVAESKLSLPVKALVPKRYLSKVAMNDAASSYKLIIAVVVAHALGVTLLLTAKPAINEVAKLPVTMTVSLVSNPAPQPEVTAVQSVMPQPEIKKQKPVAKQKTVVKQKIVTTTEPTSDSVVEDKVTKEAVVAQPATENTLSETVNKADLAPAELAAPAKAEAEPTVELPKFGAAYLNNPAPTYPPMARRFGEQGRVLLKVLVSETGNAEKVQIENSSGYNKLDQAAIEAVKQWTFIPAKRSNQAISAYVLVPIKFSLNS